jgi:hypothetical protein
VRPLRTTGNTAPDIRFAVEECIKRCPEGKDHDRSMAANHLRAWLPLAEPVSSQGCFHCFASDRQDELVRVWRVINQSITARLVGHA